jgi:hypothetical protein
MSVPGEHAERVERRRAVSRRTWTPATFGPGMLLGALGALGVVVSLFLPWRDGGVTPSEIPLQFLWDKTPGSQDPSLLVILVPLAIILVIGAFVPMGAGVRLFGSIAVAIVAVLFAYQLDRALSAVSNVGVGDVLDTGFYVAVIGAIIAFVSALLPSGWSTRRDVVETSAVDDRVT